MGGDMYKRIIRFNPSDFLLIEKLSDESAGELFKALFESAYEEEFFEFDPDDELEILYSFFTARARDQDLF